MNRKIVALVTFLLTLLLGTVALAGTTGKVAGLVTDAATGEPLAGVNIVVEGTMRGAATNLDGEYVILNIRPGTYVIQMSSLGYQTMRIEKVRVNIDKTAIVDGKLTESILEAAPAVTVTAERPVVKHDLTSSEVMVGTDDLVMMPVENVGEVVNLQAGVVEGHFRGGRSGEVAYMIDGVLVSDPYASSDPFGRATSNQVENSAIQEIQIISGTFNAEYGQAMSGIVNVVTKEGDSKKYEGNASIAIGDYVSDQTTTVGLYDNDEQNYLDNLNPLDWQDYQFSLSGPIPGTKGDVTFFTNMRRLHDGGRLYGQRVFMPGDSSDFSSANSEDWYVNPTGDNEAVTLDPFDKLSGQLKMTWRLPKGQKLSYSVLADNMEYQNLDNLMPEDNIEDPRKFKYNPDGMYTQYAQGMNHILGWNHALSGRTYYTLNLSYTQNDYQFYVHEDPNDERYVNPDRLRDALNFAFYTGGQGMWHQERSTKKAGLKFDMTHQASKLHELKGGFDLNQYQLTLEEYQLIWDDQLRDLIINPLSAWNHNKYPAKSADSPFGGFPFGEEGFRPTSFASYVQDKIEYDFMVVNLGVRLDYFHSDGTVPEDFRDPSNDRFTYFDPESGERISDLDPINPVNSDGSTNPWRNKYKAAKALYQFSPRVGIAFPLTDKGVVHFSYGHFFQVPPFQYLYYNPEFNILPGQLRSKVGNAELKPEKTVMYEIGLQQEIADGLGLNITGFYKDIRNLLGTEIRETYDQKKYARYVNRDYGNVRGVTVALDQRMSNMVSASLDYTFQIAEGNSSNPNDVFQNNQADPPRETEKKVVPLDWDQSHTINASVNLGDPRSWSVGVIGRIGSGLPYTSTPFLQQEGTMNGERKPMRYNLDFKAYKVFEVVGFKATLALNVYNLLDIRNEVNVFSDTGRATYTLERNQAFNVQGYNTLDDYFTHPEFFSAPRRVKLSLTVGF